MKTIEQRGKVKRVSDLEAAKIVESGSGTYVPKARWKAIRDEDKKPSKTKTAEELVVEELAPVEETPAPKKVKKEKKIKA
jgi:hypothetical protein